MVPEGWVNSLLDDAARRRSGHTPNKKIPEYWNGGIKWVSLSDSSVLDNGHIYETDKEISDQGLKNSSAVLLPKGTVVLSRDAGVGKSAVLGEDMAVSQHFIAWTCEEDSKLNNWFLYNWMQMKKPLFERMAVGSTIKTIGLPFFKKLRLHLPPLPEQRKIADILSTWDRAIEKTESLLANARTQKRALMQSLLTGKRRFPAFEGQPWKEVRLGDVADLITKGTTPTSAGFQFTTSGVNFIKAENVSDSGHILPAKMFISDECNEALRRSQFETGDLLVTIAGAIGRIGIVLEKNLPANTNQAVAIVRIPLSSAITRRMLFYWLHSNHIQSIFRSSVTTGAQPNINLKQIGDLPLKIPSSAEQDMIVAALDAASQEVDVIVADLTKLRTEKKALMQQLLTGKRRVVV